MYTYLMGTPGRSGCCTAGRILAHLHNAGIVVPDTAKLDCLIPNLQDQGLVLECKNPGKSVKNV